MESIFLTAAVWAYFNEHNLERPDASRFRRSHPLTDDTICICGVPAFPGNPITAAHRIPASAQRDFALRSEILNDPANFVWAHRRECNDAAELGPKQIIWRLWYVYGVRVLPAFLPVEIRELWARETGTPLPERAPTLTPGPVRGPAVPDQITFVERPTRRIDIAGKLTVPPSPEIKRDKRPASGRGGDKE